jgi:hypothetical protein
MSNADGNATKRSLLLSEYVLTDEQLQAIGCLAFESTFLERYIEIIIADNCGFDENAMTIFVGSKLTIGPKLQTMSKLIRPKLPTKDLKDSFERLYHDLMDVITKRNTVIHGTWESKNLSALAAIASGQRIADAIAQNRKNHTVPAVEVKAIAIQMADLRMELLEWYFKEIKHADTAKTTSAK